MSFLAGLVTSLGLIVAIGAQNMHVLRCGLQHRHVTLVVMLCVLSDAGLIAAGVWGLGPAWAVHPRLADTLRLVGGLFLAGYTVWAGRRALRGGQGLWIDRTHETSAGRTALVTLALTWLNPQVYIDTVVLLGTLAQVADQRGLFALGAVAGSAAFFSLLGYASAAAAPWLARPVIWRGLDGVIAVVMAGAAWHLLVAG